MKKKLTLAICLLCFFQTTFAQADSTVTTAEKASVTDRVIDWYNGHLNYGTVTLLMTIESSFIPFPSEVIVPPAAYQACNADNEALFTTSSKVVNVLFVILFATLGALIGATINYFLALWLGRPIVYWFADSKVGHLLLLNSAKIKKAEDYFIEHGKSSTLIGRLIPAIRQLISIPAGLAKMNFGIFILFTAIGASIWNTVLAFLGYFAHGQQDLIERYNGELKIVLWILCFAFVGYLIYKGVKSSRAQKVTPDNTENLSE
ncbi:MAG: DedA family protein [Bacteroidales bacterium]|nr:DedA family protein [Bacteroidales bacterium]